MRVPRPLLVVPLLLVASVVGADDPLLRNGDFSQWEGDLPAGWRAEVGATNGAGAAESSIAKGPDGGVSLAGDAGTVRWRLLGQEVRVRRGATFRLSFEARLVGGAREGNQFDNAYVGVRTPRARAFEVEAVRSETWTPGEVWITATEPTLDVLVFLSKTGRLDVRRVDLRELKPEDSFELLSRALRRHYPTFPLRGIEPEAWIAAWRPRFEGKHDEVAFLSVAREMLAELKDIHVWFRTSEGRTEPAFPSPVRPNADPAAVEGALEGARRFGKVAVLGEAGPGLVYLGVHSLEGDDAGFLAVADAAVEALKEAKGVLLDLRMNGGGNETFARLISSLFVDEPRVYARRRVRNGPRADDLSEPEDARVWPAKGGRRFAGPVVVLLGPGCVSSGEGFAQMMDVLPNVTTVGQPTRGASGNPAPVDLPNGLSVWFSRWVNLLPDGTVLEGRGVVPDVVVPHEGPGDPTFEAALKVLKEQVGG